MKILVVGSGGREHAIAWRLSKDSEAHELYCAPGNAGTVDVAENVAIAADDIDSIVGLQNPRRWTLWWSVLKHRW